MGEQDRSALVRIARQYYLDQLPLRQIAAKRNISITSVSRLLAKAREEGLVEIKIHDVDFKFRDLEATIEAKYGLEECRVVPYSENTETVYFDMAQVVSDTFRRHLRGRTYLGVSWGETLKAIGQYLKLSGVKQVRVVPIIGAMGTIETGVYANSIAKSFAEKLGGVSYLVNPPAIFHSRTIKNSVRRDKNFNKVIGLWGKIDVALLSVSGLGADASVARFGIFSSGELKYLRSLGVVCATNFNMIDANGQLVENKISERIITMNLQQLRNVKNVILAACGMRKVRAIIAALRGHIPDLLITDEKTAALLLK